MISVVDSVQDMCHSGVMEALSLIQSSKFPRVFFRNEKARFWADNTVRNNVSCTEYLAVRADMDNEDYMIIHPDDDPDDVPSDYQGNVISFKKEEKVNFAN